VVLHELQRQPVTLSMLKRVLGFAERVWKRGAGDIVKVCMTESFELARKGVTSCWAAQLLNCLSKHGFDCEDRSVADVADDVCGGACVDREVMLNEWRDIKGLSVGDQPVRDIPDDMRDGFKTTKYMRWFAEQDVDLRGRYWYHLCRPFDINAVARFRMSSHDLNVEMQRCHGLTRSQRVCACCSMLDVEDEWHVVFDCPLYHPVRLDHIALFQHVPTDCERDTGMKCFMNDPDAGQSSYWRRLASFVRKIEHVRSVHLA
jgi:hypothetical protein